MGTTSSSEVNTAQGEAVFAKSANQAKKSPNISIILFVCALVLLCISIIMNVMERINQPAKEEPTAVTVEKTTTPALADQLSPTIGSKYIVFPAFSAQIKIPDTLSRLKYSYTYGFNQIQLEDEETQHAAFCLSSVRYSSLDETTTSFTSQDPDTDTSASSCIGYILDIYSQDTYKKYIDDIDYGDTEQVYENSDYIFFIEDATSEDIFPGDSDYQSDLYDTIYKMYAKNITDYQEE